MNCGRCDFTTCRYNFDHKCTDKRHRQECVEVKHDKYRQNQISDNTKC